MAASQGTIARETLAQRPLLRAGDVLESVPGVLISQHSGEGKANQYYARGFNLDHGTDFATFVAGVPVNMPTHAHGQGYSDLNFFIPELVSGVQYRKGTYSAEDGDFSTAGTAQIAYRNSLEKSIVSATGGEEAHGRLFLATSPRVGDGHVLLGLELLGNDGPWEHPDNYRKVNGLLRWSRGDDAHGLSVTAMGYGGHWNSTDQIPSRAVSDGRLSRFGTVDATDGGDTHRYSLSLEWQRVAGRSLTEASAYALAYDLNLFSNFTYFLSDSLNGDQFEQADDRVTTGFRIAHTIARPIAGREARNSFGVHFRHDNIAGVGLYATRARQRLSTVREDHVLQTSASPFFQTDWALVPRLRAVFGLRGELYRFDVESNDPMNSGVESDALVSPKLSLIGEAGHGLTLFGNAGYGFHSNDARGATITRDPVTGDPADRVSPLVRSKGAEVGSRWERGRRFSASASAWLTDLESELVFVGDAGTTEPSRPSRRRGIELMAQSSPARGLMVDAAYAYAHARFRDDDPAGDRIPGAVEGILSAGAGYEHSSGVLGSLRARYFGPRPLIEDNSVRSESSTIFNTQAGYRSRSGWAAMFEVFNLFDAEVSDVDYFYASRLPGEPAAGIEDVHTHPQEPRSLRFTLSMRLPR